MAQHLQLALSLQHPARFPRQAEPASFDVRRFRAVVNDMSTEEQRSQVLALQAQIQRWSVEELISNEAFVLYKKLEVLGGVIRAREVELAATDAYLRSRGVEVTR